MSVLVILKLEELRYLRDLYKNEYSNDKLIGFHLLDNFLVWLEKEPDLKHVTVYSLKDEWRKSGLYLIVDRYSLFLNSLKPGDESIKVALKLLNWTRGYKITALPEIHHEIVAETLKELKINWREVKLQVFRFSWQNAMQLTASCPPGFKIQALDSRFAAVVDNHFYSQQAGSLHFFERLLRLNMSVGVFDEQTEELVAWCTRCQNGFLASLLVLPKYRGRGLAELIIKVFSLELAKLQKPEDTFAAVYVQNEASLRIFNKMNFSSITKVFHMVAYCVPKGLEWPFD